jgi:hypothetical protein
MSRFEINPNTREPYVQEPRRRAEHSTGMPAQATVDSMRKPSQDVRQQVARFVEDDRVGNAPH